jgi:hypothetical protein
VTRRYHNSTPLSSVKRRRVEVNFEGGEITSDGGVLLLREADRHMKLTQAINRAMKDLRQQGRCRHSQLSLLQQRIYALALGYEDLNDHQTLRHDGALQTAAGELQALASPSTLHRLEQRHSQHTAIALHEVLVQQFIASFAKAPHELILDFDATHNIVHGEQEGRHFNGFYDDYCFLPLYVFCEQHLLVSYLRPASRGAAHHAPAVLRLLAKRLRQAWPEVRIIIRADGGFCTPLLLNWCDFAGIDYVIGMASNPKLAGNATAWKLLASTGYKASGKAQKHYGEFAYKTRTWRQKRRLIVKAEYSERGENTRYIVTSLTNHPRRLYDDIYCARGNMENCIKEQKALFSERTSCHHWWPNQLRLLLSGFAYVLMHGLRRLALQNTALAKCQVDTIRLKLLKIGGIVIRNTRRIRILLSSQFAYQDEFKKAVQALTSG